MQKKFTTAFILFILVCASQAKLNAQTNLSVATGTASIGVASPNASAILDVTSTAKGVLIPRMTSAQKTAIAAPATGLLVYQTDGAAGFYYYNGAAWQVLSSAGGSGWGLTGNAGTNAAVNFIGTTDAQPFVFKVNSQRAGYLDFTGGNTSFGYKALKAITSGVGNVAFGLNALSSDTSGYSNIAIGNAALIKSAAGHNQVAIGDSAMYYELSSGQGNTAVGSKTLYKGTTASYNTAVGYNAMYSTTTGAQNQASGYFALNANTTGTGNSANGFKSLALVTKGNSNTAAGAFALYGDTTGSNNVAVGISALYNAAVGQYTVAVGDSSAYLTTNTKFNTSVGSRSLYSNTTGKSLTAVGALSDVTVANLTNATVLGYQASATASNQVRVGNSAVTSIGGYVNWSNISDGRFKKNIKEDVKGLAFIRKLKPVTYTLDITGINNFIRPGSAQGQQTQPGASANADAGQINGMSEDQASVATKEKVVYSGFIAQDVEKSAKDLNYDFSGVDAPKSKTDLYGLRYSDFVVPLVKAVQELSFQNDSMQAANQQLQKDNKDLKNTVNNIQTQLGNILQQLNDLRTAQEACCFNALNKQPLDPNTGDAARLEQNVPNPFNANTLIRYYLPATSVNAQLMITNVSGQVLKSYALTAKGIGQTTIYAGELASGNYFYTLMVDGKKIATKQMVLLQ